MIRPYRPCARTERRRVSYGSGRFFPTARFRRAGVKPAPTKSDGPVEQGRGLSPPAHLAEPRNRSILASVSMERALPRSLSENKFPSSTDKESVVFRSRGASAPRGSSSSARYSREKTSGFHRLDFSSSDSPGEARHSAWMNEPAPRRCPSCGSGAKRDEPGAAAPPQNGRPPLSRLSPLPHTPSLPRACP